MVPSWLTTYSPRCMQTQVHPQPRDELDDILQGSRGSDPVVEVLALDALLRSMSATAARTLPVTARGRGRRGRNGPRPVGR